MRRRCSRSLSSPRSPGWLGPRSTRWSSRWEPTSARASSSRCWISSASTATRPRSSTVTNAEERQYLEGAVPDAQLGTRAISSAYVHVKRRRVGDQGADQAHHLRHRPHVRQRVGHRRGQGCRRLRRRSLRRVRHRGPHRRVQSVRGGHGPSRYPKRPKKSPRKSWSTPPTLASRWATPMRSPSWWNRSSWRS